MLAVEQSQTCSIQLCLRGTTMMTTTIRNLTAYTALLIGSMAMATGMATGRDAVRPSIRQIAGPCSMLLLTSRCEPRRNRIMECGSFSFVRRSQTGLQGSLKSKSLRLLEPMNEPSAGQLTDCEKPG